MCALQALSNRDDTTMYAGCGGQHEVGRNNVERLAITDVLQMVELRKRTLRVDPDVAGQLIDSPYLSISAIDKLRSCQASYAMYRITKHVDLPTDPKSASNIGVATHRVLESLMAESPERRTSARAQEIFNELMANGELVVPGDDDELGTWSDRVLQLVDGLFHIEDPAQVKVFGIEQELRGEIDGVTLLGYADRIDERNGMLGIVDYKTGKLPAPRWRDSLHFQLTVYTMLIEQMFGRQVESAHDYFLDARKSIMHTPDEAELRQARESIVSARRTHERIIERGEFEYRPSRLCSWCPLAALCPAAAARGFDEPSTIEGVLFREAALQPEPQHDDTNDTEKGADVTRFVEGMKPWDPPVSNGRINIAGGAVYIANHIAQSVVGLLALESVDGELPNRKRAAKVARLVQAVVYRAADNLMGGQAAFDGEAAKLAWYAVNQELRAAAPIPRDDAELTEWGEALLERVTYTLNLTGFLASQVFNSDEPYDPERVFDELSGVYD